MVERRGIVANAVGSGDVNLPSLIKKGAPLRDGDGDAQADGDLDVFASRCMHNEGHGKPLTRAPPGCHAPANFIPLQRRKRVAHSLRDRYRFRLASERESFAWRSCSNESSGERAIAIRRIGEGTIVRRASASQRLWKIRLGNPPVHSFRRAEPRDASESLPPIFEPPWASACGVFPNTRNPCRFRCGKSRHKMIDAGKGEALWLRLPWRLCALVRTL